MLEMNRTLKAIQTDIARIEDITQQVRDSDSIDPGDVRNDLVKLAESIQLLASCVNLLAMTTKKAI